MHTAIDDITVAPGVARAAGEFLRAQERERMRRAWLDSRMTLSALQESIRRGVSLHSLQQDLAQMATGAPASSVPGTLRSRCKSAGAAELAAGAEALAAHFQAEGAR